MPDGLFQATLLLHRLPQPVPLLFPAIYSTAIKKTIISVFFVRPAGLLLAIMQAFLPNWPPSRYGMSRHRP
ncbi:MULTISPECIES: hypothetical protein [Novosphingobium]|uniref:hypothetical protein n=1 Tax=Novosphingobium TaxID=165696 RepID=UPI0011AB61F8|nr:MULTISPECIES: hypothetical protein [Novosphingobium]